MTFEQGKNRPDFYPNLTLPGTLAPPSSPPLISSPAASSAGPPARARGFTSSSRSAHPRLPFARPLGLPERSETGAETLRGRRGCSGTGAAGWRVTMGKKDKEKKAAAAEENGAGEGIGEQQAKGDFHIAPMSTTPQLDTSKWPLLLKNYDKLNVRTGHYTPIPNGYTPLKRPLKEYMLYGCVNLDKPSNPSSHEVGATPAPQAQARGRGRFPLSLSFFPCFVVA